MDDPVGGDSGVEALVVSRASPEVRSMLDEFSEVLKSIVDANYAIIGIEEAEIQTGWRVDPEDWGGTATDLQISSFPAWEPSGGLDPLDLGATDEVLRSAGCCRWPAADRRG
jgi:hypothetical protein